MPSIRDCKKCHQGSLARFPRASDRLALDTNLHLRMYFDDHHNLALGSTNLCIYWRHFPHCTILQVTIQVMLQLQTLYIYIQIYPKLVKAPCGTWQSGGQGTTDAKTIFVVKTLCVTIQFLFLISATHKLTVVVSTADM